MLKRTFISDLYKYSSLPTFKVTFFSDFGSQPIFYYSKYPGDKCFSGGEWASS